MLKYLICFIIGLLLFYINNTIETIRIFKGDEESIDIKGKQYIEVQYHGKYIYISIEDFDKKTGKGAGRIWDYYSIKNEKLLQLLNEDKIYSKSKKPLDEKEKEELIIDITIQSIKIFDTYTSIEEFKRRPIYKIIEYLEYKGIEESKYKGKSIDDVLEVIDTELLEEEKDAL